MKKQKRKVYLKAAQQMSRAGRGYCCISIALQLGEYGSRPLGDIPEVQEFVDLFCPTLTNSHRPWGWLWSDEYNKGSEDKNWAKITREATVCRVLALCFVAAITKEI